MTKILEKIGVLLLVIGSLFSLFEGNSGKAILFSSWAIIIVLIMIEENTRKNAEKKRRPTSK